MQEEVENRTVNLVVSTTKLTARLLIRGLRWYLMSRNQKRMRKAMTHEEGKQSVAFLFLPHDHILHGNVAYAYPAVVAYRCNFTMLLQFIVTFVKYIIT